MLRYENPHGRAYEFSNNKNLTGKMMYRVIDPTIQDTWLFCSDITSPFNNIKTYGDVKKEFNAFWSNFRLVVDTTTTLYPPNPYLGVPGIDPNDLQVVALPGSQPAYGQSKLLPETIEQHKCRCSLETIWREGCKCNGI